MSAEQIRELMEVIEVSEGRVKNWGMGIVDDIESGMSKKEVMKNHQASEQDVDQAIKTFGSKRDIDEDAVANTLELDGLRQMGMNADKLLQLADNLGRSENGTVVDAAEMVKKHVGFISDLIKRMV